MTTIEIDEQGAASIDGIDIDPAMVADIRKFETQLARYLDGDLDEDVFKVFRLANGIYGQRQVASQMVRVKIPFGRLDEAGLVALADVADRWSRGSR